ncbi:MAG: phosphate ABC transporter permease subunit PstC, partial [Pseudomonas sp.]
MNDTVQPLVMTTHASDVSGDSRAARDQRHDLWFKRSMFGAAMLVLLLLASIAAST